MRFTCEGMYIADCLKNLGIILSMKNFPNIQNNRYEIKSQLGQGGFATMFKARDKKRNRSCVIKELSLERAHDWKSIELFEREARILSNLDHPNIPDFVDSFTLETDEQTRFYLVQEYVNGKSLKDWISGGKHFTEKEVLKIGLKITEVLEYLHGFSPPIIHRDIKPGNLMIKPDNTAYLVDFGSVKDQLLNQQKEQGSTVVGTFGYMPIEQFEGRASAKSDIYALGMSLIFALSHRDPKDMDKNGLKIDFQNHVNISQGFKIVLDKMIEPDARQRVQSATELKRLFQQLIAGEKVKPGKNNEKRVSSMVTSGIILAVLLTISASFIGYFSVVKVSKKTSTNLTAETYLEMGNKATKKSSYGVAIIHYNHALERNPNLVEAYYQRANAFFHKKQFRKAIKDYDSSLKLKPIYPAAHNDRGVAYNRLNLNHKALNDYNKAIEQKPKYIRALRNRAQLYSDMKKDKLSIKDYSTLISLDNVEDLHRDYNDRGARYFSLKQYELAIQDFKKATEINPMYKYPHYNLGLIALNQKKLKEAIKHFDQAILKDPKYVFAYNERGRAYLKLKSFDKAEENFNHALVINPKFLMSMNNLGFLYETKKEYKTAIDYYNKALRINPKSSLALINRGNTYRYLNQCEKAVKDYQSSCNLGNSLACKKTCPK